MKIILEIEANIFSLLYEFAASARLQEIEILIQVCNLSGTDSSGQSVTQMDMSRCEFALFTKKNALKSFNRELSYYGILLGSFSSVQR